MVLRVIFLVFISWGVFASADQVGNDGPGGGDVFKLKDGKYKTWDEVEWNRGFIISESYPEVYSILMGQVDKLESMLPHTGALYRLVLQQNVGLSWYLVSPKLKDVKDEGNTNLVISYEKIQAAVQKNGMVQIPEYITKKLSRESLAYLFWHEVSRYIFEPALDPRFVYKKVRYACDESQFCEKTFNISGEAIRQITGLTMHRKLELLDYATIGETIISFLDRFHNRNNYDPDILRHYPALKTLVDWTHKYFPDHRTTLTRGNVLSYVESDLGMTKLLLGYSKREMEMGVLGRLDGRLTFKTSSQKCLPVIHLENISGAPISGINIGIFRDGKEVFRLYNKDDSESYYADRFHLQHDLKLEKRDRKALIKKLKVVGSSSEDLYQLTVDFFATVSYINSDMSKILSQLETAFEYLSAYSICGQDDFDSFKAAINKK